MVKVNRKIKHNHARYWAWNINAVIIVDLHVKKQLSGQRQQCGVSEYQQRQFEQQQREQYEWRASRFSKHHRMCQLP